MPTFVKQCKAASLNVGVGQTYQFIQDAINASSNGDTVYVYNGTYYENIIVNKSITLMGENKHNTTIDGIQNNYVVQITTDNVNVSGFTIQNSSSLFDLCAGIYIEANFTNMSGNIIANNTGLLVGYGIYLSTDTCNNIIANNTIYNNTYNGIGIETSNNNTIANNTISNHSSGIQLLLAGSGLTISNSYNNTFTGNTFLNNSMLISGTDLSHFIHNIDNNTVNGKPLYYYTNDSDFSVPDDAGEIIIINCSNYTIDGVELLNTSVGIEIVLSSEIVITNSSINQSGYGLLLWTSSNSTIDNVTFSNSNFACSSTGDSQNNTIRNNNFIQNGYACFVYQSNETNLSQNTMENNTFGLTIYNSLNITIIDNTFLNDSIYLIGTELNYFIQYIENNTVSGKPLYYYKNQSSFSVPTDAGAVILVNCTDVNIEEANNISYADIGIHLAYSDENNIFNSNISSSYVGIYLYESENNTIYQNNITDNYDGIEIDSDNNDIYHNNFINNTINAYCDYTNSWYNSIIKEGNYWYNFDEASEDAYDNNSNGLIDSPYDINGSGNNQDLYPLTGPWGQRPYQATVLSPTDGATGVSTSPTLKVQVSDPNNDTMNVSFYWTSGNTLLKTVTNVANGDNASYTWSGRSSGTTYNWYVIVNDSTYLTKSNIWSFKTTDSPGGGSTSPPSVNQAPVANSGGPYTGYVNQAITFDASASTDDVAIIGYRWDWSSDGTYDTTWLTTNTTSHTYTSQGVYIVKLEVKDSQGLTSTDTATVTVTNIVQNPPVADAGGPYNGLTFKNIIFDGSNSDDSDGNIVNYTWNFGDGNIGYGEKPVHSYTTQNLFNITLTVTDDDGLTDSDTTTINVLLDSDADGVDDETELELGLDPFKKDITILEIDEITFYSIDTDADGLPDRFYDPLSGKNITSQKKADGKYLLDLNGDGTWDYTYDPASGEITAYEEEKPSEGLPLLWIALIIIIVIIVIIGLLFAMGIIYIEKEKK